MPDVPARLRAVVADVAGVPAPAIRDETDWSSLHLDSLDVLELVPAIEMELNIGIPDERLEGMRTFGDLVAVVGQLTEENG